MIARSTVSVGAAGQGHKIRPIIAKTDHVSAISIQSSSKFFRANLKNLDPLRKSDESDATFN